MSANRALVIGVSDYPKPAWNLPAVSADVREIAKLLGSDSGSFDGENVSVLTDTEATRSNVLSGFRELFEEAAPDSTTFAYLAGHGAVDPATGSFYFIPHDADIDSLGDTAVPLTELRDAFDRTASRRAFLWLDFCHSGGIIARKRSPTTNDENEVIGRTLQIVQGEGRLIFAACTSEQAAYESSAVGHGMFTEALLDGLKGAAASSGEVTAGSLFDFIDRKMGSERQRPMQFGQMRGRIVLMQYGDRGESELSETDTSGAADLVVESSGSLAFLSEGFFEDAAVHENADNTITVELSTTTAEEEAAIRRLRPPDYGRTDPVPFAFGNLGIVARVRDVRSSSGKKGLNWTITLQPDDVEYGGGMMEVTYQTDSKKYTPDEFARLRAGRLLLNDPPPLPAESSSTGQLDRINEAMLESYIRSSQGAPASVEHCVLRRLYTVFSDDPAMYLKAARLMAVYFIRAAGIAEEILDLSLGPIRNGQVHVRFLGRRRRRFSNVDPAVIEVEGDCSLD